VKHREILYLLLISGCTHGTAAVDSKGDAGPPTPVDHLATNELSHSKVLAFGLPIPEGMKVERRFASSVYLTGSVSATALADFVRAHAIAGPLERIGNRRVFSKVKIRGGDSSRLYDIEIDETGATQKLIVTDVTPPPLTPGLTVEERWRRAGYMPDGTPIPSAQGM